MFETGMFLNDLSIHDSSRELVLLGTQQQAELKLTLDQVKCTHKEGGHHYSREEVDRGPGGGGGTSSNVR